MRRAALITLGYAIELVCATFAYAALWVWFGSKPLATFIVDSWIAWTSVCGFIFATATTLFAVLFSVSASEFGGYLASRNADRTYKRAFGTAIAIAFCATISFIFAGTLKAPVMAHVSGVLFLLTVINLYTMLKNASDLMKMHTLFEEEKRKFEGQD